MNYINTTTLEYPLSEFQIKQARPNVSFPIPFEPGDGYAAVAATEQPAFNRYTHKAVESAPTHVGDVWTQQWEVVALTPEEAAAMVPQAVTMRQARLALLGAGLLSQVDAAIASLPSPQKEAAAIEWEYAQEVQRHNGLVPAMAQALGMTEAQLDDLFMQAATL